MVEAAGVYSRMICAGTTKLKGAGLEILTVTNTDLPKCCIGSRGAQGSPETPKGDIFLFSNLIEKASN